MASVDLKDAFFTVPVHNLHQKFFMSEWIRKFCKCVGMPNVYSDAIRTFTKILKPAGLEISVGHRTMTDSNKCLTDLKLFQLDIVS